MRAADPRSPLSNPRALRIASSAAPSRATAFACLDDAVHRTGAFGVIRVIFEGDDAPVASLARHVARRARQHGREAVVAAGPRLAAPWRHVARQLGVELDGHARQTPEVAAGIATRGQGGVIIVANDENSAWGEAVARDLCHLATDPARGLLLVLLGGAASDAPEIATAVTSNQAEGGEAGPVRLELRMRSDDELTDRARWWDAVLMGDALVEPARNGALQQLDRWWEAARRQPLEAAPQAPTLSDDATLLFDFAVHARQGLDQATVKAAGFEPATLRELHKAGLCALPSGALPSGALPSGDGATEPMLVALDDTFAGPLSAPNRRRLATALADSPTSDAWSMMRAAELHAVLGDDADAERLAFAALRRCGDKVARDDLWRRWDGVIDTLGEASSRRRKRKHTAGPNAALERLLRASAHALELGDSDRADRMARSAMSLAAQLGEQDRFDVLVLHGRASYARGDTTTAALSLARALNVAEHEAERARAAALMAQVRYMAGDPTLARRHAEEAIAQGAEAETRLDGRNVIGKLLLAREAWAEAEQHFATDAYDATRADNKEYELRARLNRAIAVLYLGRREQAREMLEEIMEDGEASGVHRAVAYTLSNLATIALLQHQYERALALLEKAIEVRRRYETRIGLVLPIANLAELRLRLGLVAEAEHSLRFGLQACGQGLPLSRYAYFAKVAACIHLERGETSQATKEIRTAISGATSGGDVSALARCHRIAARIALHDGDVARARAAVAQASKQRNTPSGKAELAILVGLCQRAAGDAFLEEASEALLVAQQADDPESLREAHQLLFYAFAMDGDREAARSHLRCALEARDRIAEALAPVLRQRYLNRTALAELRELEMGIDDDLEFTLGAGIDADGPVTLRSLQSSRAGAGGRGGLSGAGLGGAGLGGTGLGRARLRAGKNKTDSRRLSGESSSMRALRGTIRRVAPTSATILVTGETGCGKELVAEAIHRASERADGPLVKVNCAALVETLLLSELFGHEKGAFTGASSRRRGRFELAEGGTLFLDEIGDISPRTQVALLRVLQDGIFERVGGTTSQHADVRIVCATHRDLEGMVERGDFRRDLYYRLCGVQLEVVPLKDRISDLPVLAKALLARAADEHGITPRPLSRDALRTLGRHAWPGNVRELQNALRVAALFAKGEQIEIGDFTENVESLRYLADLPTGASTGADHDSMAPRSMTPRSVTPRSMTRRGSHEGRGGDGVSETLPPPASSAELVYAEIRGGTKLADMKRKLEQDCIARALVETGGNITRAATLLGMKRPRLSQLVKQYELGSVLEDIKS
jgi:DNA-binding NtrC family response regulator/tetratricopeptide (TPR) repeat protein